MPIETKVRTRKISRDDFYQLDYKVMGLAFTVHNDFGRFWDERIYQRELAHCCINAGFDNVLIEAPIIVSYKDFRKRYFVDLLIDDAIVYEFKAVKELRGEHHRQTLNYLFLFGLTFGKLLNFRPSSLESRFVSTTVATNDRFRFVVDEAQWVNLDAESEWLKALMLDLLHEWGAFLDTNLFVQAVAHFRGGEERVLKDVQVLGGSRRLGYQRMNLLTPEVAFKISAITSDLNFYEQHLQRILNHTALRAIQWINLNHNKIQFKTITS